MSWLFSQALVAEYLEGTCSDGAPFAPSSGNPTPQAYLPPDKMTAFSRPSRFGMTFAPLTDDRGEELLTWFLAASRARTSAPQALGLALTGSDLVFGGKWRELSVRYDRDSCSWRTHRSLWDEDLPESSVILPRWGLMRNGVCLERMTLALPTAANDAGLWPTPVAHDDGKTPEAHMAMKARMKGGPRHKPTSLTVMVKGIERGMWPTPCARDHFPAHKPEYIEAKRAQGHGMSNLNDAVAHPHMFPTPTATNTKAHHMRGADNGKEREARSYGETGQLNPTWVEWLMGWPLGWTDLKPLETDRCRNAQRRHGGF